MNPDETGIDSLPDRSSGTSRPAAATANRTASDSTEPKPYDAEEIADECLDTDDADGPIYRCASCDDRVDTREWHPVVARSNGAPTVYLFCGAACRREWLGHGATDE